MNCRRLISLLLAVFMLAGAMPAFAAADGGGRLQSVGEQPRAQTFRAGERINFIDGSSADTEGSGLTEPDPAAPAVAPDSGAVTDLSGETAEPSALIDTENPWFCGVNLSGAGAEQLNGWAEGFYYSFEDESEGEGGGHAVHENGIMIACMQFSDWSGEEMQLGFFVSRTGQPAVHELTLYAQESLSAADITLSGVTVLSTPERHVYGDDGGELYWYTAKIQVPAEDTVLKISVKGRDYAEIPITHVGGVSPVALFSTAAVYDSTESEIAGYCDTVTLKLSGFGLPDDPAAYNLVWGDYDETVGEPVDCFVPGSSITGPDEMGYSFVTFDFRTVYREDLEHDALAALSNPNGIRRKDLPSWVDLRIGHVDVEKYIYDEENVEPDGEHLSLPRDGNDNVKLFDYSAFFFDPSHLDQTEDGYELKSSYAYYEDPYFYLGGSYVSIANVFQSLFKGLPNSPEEKPSVSVGGYQEYYGIAVIPDGEASITIDPGSYEGGEVRVLVNGDTAVDWTEAAAGKTLSFQLCDWEGKPVEDYGSFNIRTVFRGNSLRYYGVSSELWYWSGVPSAITTGRVLDSATGEEAGKDSSGSYILKGSEDKVYIFEASVPQDYQHPSLDQDFPDKQILVCEFYDSEGVILKRTMTDYKNENWERAWSLRVKRSEIVEAEGVRIFNSGEAPCFTGPGEALDIKLANEMPFVLRTLQAPTVDNTLLQDENGVKYHAVKLGKELTAVFEASSGEPWSRAAMLEYMDTEGDMQYLPLDESVSGKHSFRVSVRIPEDAALLSALRYTLTNTETEESESLAFDLSDYRVAAEMTFKGFPESYIGTTFRFTSLDTLEGVPVIDKYVILTEDNISCVSLGDLPTGGYTYEISGKTGHITGTFGNGSLVPMYYRGGETVFESLPALASLTVNTVGFESGMLFDEEHKPVTVNPPARLNMTVKTPDGKSGTVTVSTGTKLEEIPVNSTISIDKFSFDATAYEEISGVSPAGIDAFTLTGDTEKTFTYQPFEWRTITGKVAHPADGPRYLAQHATVVLTQKVTRGGVEELYTRSVRVDADGNYSILCYDHIPAKLSFRSYYFGNSSMTVTAEGDADAGIHTLASSEDMELMVNLSVRTPNTHDRMGYRMARDKYGNLCDDSVLVESDSAVLTLSQLSTYYDNDWHYFGPEDDAFDTYVMGGKLFVRVHPEYFGTTMYLNFKNSVSIGGVNHVLENGGRVVCYTNQNENSRYVNVTALRSGGEIWATVVNPDSNYTGFLVHITGHGPKIDGKYLYTSCEYVFGKGLLRLVYDTPEEYGTVLSFMCRDADVEGFAALLSSDAQPLLDRAGELGPLRVPILTGDTFDFSSLRCPIKLHQNVIIKLDNDNWNPSIRPGVVLGSDILPAYTFTYSLKMGDDADSVVMTGTLVKRLADEVDSDLINNLSVQFYDEAAEAMATVPDLYVNGEKNYYSWSAQGKNYKELQIRAVLPLTSENKVNFTVSLNVAGGANPAKSQAIHFEEFVAVFALGGPDEVYIGDQLSLQKLEYSKKEVQAGWTLRMNMRAVASTDNADNVITVWDNGVAVGEERVWHSLNSAVDATGSFSEGACRPIQVRLTDNLTPGIHVVYLSRTWKGETIYTQPVVINLMAGMSETGIYVSDLYWWHWNSRVGGGQADEMYFRSLNDMSGYTVWIWPSKKSIMRFTIHGANAAELENVRVGYNTQESRGAMTSNHGWVNWWVPVYRTAPCKCIYAGDENAKVSIWEFEKEEYLGYIEDFEFCFDVRPSQLDKAKSMTEEERRQAELELYFETDGLGEVPDDTELVNALNNLGNDQLQEIRASAQEESALLPDYLQNLDLKTVKNDASGYEVKLNKATDQVKEYSVSMSAGGDVKVWDVWDLMDEEREIMEEKGNVDGWQVSWGETDGIQGSTLIRIAQKKYQDAQGLWHTEINRRFYVTAAVADAIEKGTSIAEAQAVRKAQSAMSSRDALQAVRKRDTVRPNAPVYDYGDPPDHWTKKTYDFSTTTVTVADMAQDVYVDALKATYSDPVKGAIEGEKAKFLPKCTSNVMNVLGVAETVIQLRNGPSGADPNDLRNLLSHVKDEKFKRSISNQIRDYEDLREAIFIQDMQIKGISTTSGFVANANIWMKVTVFVGGIANGILSDKSKEYNRQVYNTTLLDIQRQIKLEKYKAERVQADKDFKEMVRRRFGKDVADNPTRLKEEMKYWHLERDEWGDLVWKLNKKTPKFNKYIDPSGFVFEAVQEERVEGVTATLYYSPEKDGSYAVWNDANPDETQRQSNPQSTTEEGRYSWMVPTGWWKVRYEAKGYLPAETKPMPVPPVHTAVNIGLLATAAPKAAVTVNDDGTVTILFTKYMQLESLIRLFGGESYKTDAFDSSAFAVQFFDAEGELLRGTVTFPDKAANTGYVEGEYMQDVIASEYFVRTAVFTPVKGGTVDSWRFGEGILSYAGVSLDADMEAKIHLVTLDPNGGKLSVTGTVTDESGHPRSLPAPWRSGYTFEGWADARGTSVSEESVLGEDTVLYAQWSTTGGYVVELNGTAGNGRLPLCFRNNTEETDDLLYVIAAYSAEGKQLNVSTGTLSGGSGTVTYEYGKYADTDYVKAFLTKPGGMLPLCEEFYWRITDNDPTREDVS